MPIPSLKRVLDDDGRNGRCRSGQVGEICIRGPQVMQGHWNRPDRTAKVITPEGWLPHRRHGRDGRAQLLPASPTGVRDMIIVSGFKVFPNGSEDGGDDASGVLEVAITVGVRRAFGRSRQAGGGPEGPGAHRGAVARALPAPPDGLQGAAHHRSSAANPCPKTNVGRC